ncbi:MFS transporter (plasmid) [Fibrella sp. ES10-3-2-2]
MQPNAVTESTTNPVNTRSAWVIVGLLWVVALLNYLDRQMLATMRPAMQGDIQELESATNFGYLMAIFLWIYGFMSPLSGLIADRYSRKWIIVGSLAIWSGVTLAMGYATTFSQLCWLRGIMGISEALYIPAGLSLIADVHGSKTRSLAVGLHMTGLYMGQALGGFGATIAKSYSWTAAFQGFGLVGLVYALILAVFLRTGHERAERAISTTGKGFQPNRTTVLASLRMLLTNVSFWMILLYYAIPSLPGWATKNWLPTLVSTNLGIDMAQAGPLATIAIAFASFIGVLVAGILSDRWVQRNVRGRIYTSAIGLFLTIPALVLMGLGHSPVALVGAAICFGVGYGMFDANNMPILCQFVPTQSRATAYGIMNMTGVFAGAFVTNWLGKSQDSGHLGQDFALLAGIVVLVLIAQLTLLKPTAIDFALAQPEPTADRPVSPNAS